LADDTVNRFFADTDMEKQRRHQTKFIGYALGGPANYTGQSMANVHAGMNLQPVHFDAIVKHLHDALAHDGVKDADIDEALRTVGNLRDDVLYK